MSYIVGTSTVTICRGQNHSGSVPVTIRGGEKVWPNSFRFPRLGSGVEVIYHPLFVIEQRENEDVRECARRETERLAEIVRSAL